MFGDPVPVRHNILRNGQLETGEARKGRNVQKEPKGQEKLESQVNVRFEICFWVNRDSFILLDSISVHAAILGSVLALFR